ncbi:unnamed protein product, partial [marine sediment metagenome]
GILAALLVASYGLNNGRLPGGSSMLVRWQYWHAAAKMYAGHRFTGVGPGNFASFYTHYKPDGVKEPRNNTIANMTRLITPYGYNLR